MAAWSDDVVVVGVAGAVVLLPQAVAARKKHRESALIMRAAFARGPRGVNAGKVSDMDLFVVRHGIAEAAAPGQDDASRQLTPQGERKVRRVVRGLRELRWQLDRVLTSPWLRAAQTAELLEPISDDGPIPTELLCQAPRPELLAMIAENPPTKARHATAVVGHEPWLGELVALLAFGESRFGEGLTLKKAGVVWLDGTAIAGGMQIRAILPPKVLTALR